MTVRDKLQQSLEDLDHKLRHKVFQIEEKEDELTELYEELEEMEKEKIKIEQLIKEQE